MIVRGESQRYIFSIDPALSLVPDALPPQIVALEVEIGAGGLATLTVEASDPEGGFLDVQVRWGDEADREAVFVPLGGERVVVGRQVVRDGDVEDHVDRERA